MKRYVPSSVLIIMLLLYCGCSIKSIRSPIVFRSPVVFNESKPDEPVRAHIPAVAKDELIEQGSDTGILSPDSIPVLSSGEAADARFYILGKISVESPTNEGFASDKAQQYLKLEAFKRYGSMAQGIANVVYKNKSKFFSTKENLYEEASAEVVALSRRTTKGRSGTAEPASFDGKNGVLESSMENEDFTPPYTDIALISSDELLKQNFRILGKIILDDEYPLGFTTKEQAIDAMKLEAFRIYGDRVDGLTNLKFMKESKVFYYKKTRQLKTPDEPKAFMKASAEVVMLIPEEKQDKEVLMPQ